MRIHNLFFGSSYNRGLEYLLFMWGDIKKKYPDAELHIAYGWLVYDKMSGENPQRKEWKKNMISLMNQPGIKEYGRLDKKSLQELRLKCGIWAYPTDFAEINCITALECQRDGVVPVTMTYAALKYSVGCGVMVTGDIIDPEVRDKYLEELLSLMGDEKRWKEEQKKGKQFIKDFTWDKVSRQWLQEFRRKDEEPLVSIVTPTIRKGWWNIMANNIATQTYKNIEWLIIDDYPENRQGLANDYAKKYGLKIRYLRGKEHKVKRTYALVNANNTAYQNYKGELFVMLQDFMLMPVDGIEQLVYTHKKYPNALIAPVDVTFASKVEPDITKEDWFGGELYPMGKLLDENVRIQNKGLRFTNNPMDFEQNYGAIPRKVLNELGGWYEFFDEGLGYDNTEFAFRALAKGFQILIDETNVVVGIDHNKPLEGHVESGLGREMRPNDPRYAFMVELVKSNKLPLKVSQEISDQIDLQYVMPKVDKPKEWIRDHAVEISNKWIKNFKLI